MRRLRSACRLELVNLVQPVDPETPELVSLCLIPSSFLSPKCRSALHLFYLHLLLSALYTQVIGG